ncbi:ABC transporter substrate-binding protein [Proteus vulgaris]|nr:ABC transporter substrate-binding protein [Proteus vulgaris]MBI6338217.1 ABC transporter substrate-binding protein [Proteus sp. PR00224]MBI6406446.1 ABC transporter substrate-binding protein [Proteus sp. PR00208]MBI6544832.1 ABC transporter substrate-binding protein [Proteus vulgaris]
MTMKALLQHCLLGIGLLSLSFFSYADRQIVDQIGRTVTIPDKVERTVVLQHQTLNLLVQLDATDKIVGVMSNWKQQLGDGYAQLAPSLEKTPKVGDLTSFDAESLVKLQPQVVFVTNYAPKEMIDKISALGIPVVAISLRKESNDDKSKLNPTLQNEEQAYNEGLKEGILLIGDIVNKSENAQALVNDTFKQREQVSQRLQDIPKSQRVRAYMANPDLTTYGSGKYTGLMMEHAGAFNVASSTVKGYKQVSLEQVIAWDPEVIFIQDRYPQVVDEIKQDARWQVISAVKNNRIYLMPEYAKAWGYPMPEAMAIGELWMAKKLYPEKFSDIDMQKAANDWYQKFYRTQYQGKE